MDTTRAALEATLQADPDDRTAHCVYADYLIEQNDPRGEYIRLQLALEDHTQSLARRQALHDEAAQILAQHQADWLGPLHAFLGARSGPEVRVQFRRGWVDRLSLDPLTPPIAQAVAACPLLHLLSELEILSTQGWSERDLSDLMTSLPRVRIGNLRHLTLRGIFNFQLGDHPLRNELVLGLLEGTPRLEQLTLAVGDRVDLLAAMSLPRLHTLRIESHAVGAPLIALAANSRLRSLRTLENRERTDWIGTEVWVEGIQAVAAAPHLKGLTHLSLQSDSFADSGVEALLRSGLVDRLRGLDLRDCRITDDGAQQLAAHPAIPRLDYLHLDGNYLSPIGLDALAAVGVRVSQRQRFTGPDVDPNDPEGVEF